MKTFLVALIHDHGTIFNYFCALGKELISRGHRVVIIVSGSGEGRPEEECSLKVLEWPSRTPKTMKDAAFLSSLITRLKPDCILANFSTVAVCCLVGCLRRVPRRVAWNHTVMGTIELDVPVPRWKRALMTRRRQLVLECATNIIAVSKAAREDANEYYRVPIHKIEVIYPLLSEPSFDPVRPRERKIMFVGRLAASKGIDTLLRALPVVFQSIPDATVEFVGGGPQKHELMAMADELGVGDRCRFVGALSGGEVLERMSGASLLVSPSRCEALGLVNVEAHSVGLPVVASDVGGIGEVVIDGKTGFLVPPADPDALGERMIRLMRDDGLREGMGRAARAHFERNFGFRNVPRQADYFERLCRSS